MMWRAALVLTALGLGVLAVACGDDGDGASGDESSSDERQEYIDAIVAAPVNQGAAAEDMECYAGSLVDAVGIDAFHAAELTPEDVSELDAPLDDVGIPFDDAQADAFWNDMNQCMDVRAFFFETLAAGGEYADETIDCLEDTMDENLIKRFITGAITEGEDAFEEDDQLTRDLADAFSECRAGQAS